MSTRFPWLRLHSALVNNPKIQLLPAEDFKLYINVLCIAGEQPERGTLPDLAQLAFLAHLSEAQAEASLYLLQRAHLVDARPDGSLLIHDWAEWQPPQEDFQAKVRAQTARRVRAYKARQKADLTKGNVSGNVTRALPCALPGNALKREESRDIPPPLYNQESICIRGEGEESSNVTANVSGNVSSGVGQERERRLVLQAEGWQESDITYAEQECDRRVSGPPRLEPARRLNYIRAMLKHGLRAPAEKSGPIDTSQSFEGITSQIGAAYDRMHLQPRGHT